MKKRYSCPPETQDIQLFQLPLPSISLIFWKSSRLRRDVSFWHMSHDFVVTLTVTVYVSLSLSLSLTLTES